MSSGVDHLIRCPFSSRLPGLLGLVCGRNGLASGARLPTTHVVWHRMPCLSTPRTIRGSYGWCVLFRSGLIGAGVLGTECGRSGLVPLVLGLAVSDRLPVAVDTASQPPLYYDTLSLVCQGVFDQWSL